ncbi:MAG: hypothetical protein MJ230_07245 [bacterium]|nr:hypothetical protein [bacterium]
MNEQAIEISETIDALTCGLLDVCDIEPYMSTILKALEKQTPKAPKVEKYFYGKYYLCPSCGQNVNEGECCRNNECGQLLKWENIE